MRIITKHQVPKAQETLKILVADQAGDGGANHVYEIMKLEDDEVWEPMARIKFQKGPIKEKGVNGVTQEILLAIVADRLESFQAGLFACDDNQEALELVQKALTCLQKRTLARLARGVEGTSVK